MSTFSIETTKVFWAYHALRLPGGGAEPSHGHAFAVTIRIEAQKLDALETVLDFHPVEAALENILTPWEGKNLHEIPPFDKDINPSAERIAEQIGKAIITWLATLSDSAARQIRLTEVRITEAPNCLAIWHP